MNGSIIRRAAAVLAFLALVAGFAAAVWRVGHGAALDELARRGQADLALAADRLTGDLQRSRELAVLLADHPTLRPVVAAGAGADPGRLRAAADLLRDVADKTGLLDIVVTDATGRELVSATADAPGADAPTAAPPTAAPPDHAASPEFRRAMQGALGVNHGLSPRYGRRAFAFAAPVFAPGGPVIGAVIVAADIEEVEADWRGDRPVLFFSDDIGVVFLSNRSELLLRARDGDPARVTRSGAYPVGMVTAFVGYRVTRVAGHELWRVDGGPYVPARALHLTLPLPVIGMTGEVLLDEAPARALATLQAATVVALCLAFGALLFLATERRRALAGANARLEARVAQRTGELSALNADLRREVAERTAAEARLTRAQADLVQAGKLSALGQMSAGISHELNQPLMAIRSFAENAGTFLARGQPDSAARNLERIGEMARRMGRIIRNLRAFARQESEPPADVDLVAVVEAAIEMLAARAAKAGVALIWAPPPVPVIVRGGEVRLQQVVLNLMTNAIDAMDGSADARIEIALAQSGGRVLLTVRDTGPGLTEPERIFDPFYSTKTVPDPEGADGGMGLGLSISYGLVQSFGGAIRGRNHPEGGAVFTVELDAGSAAQAA